MIWTAVFNRVVPAIVTLLVVVVVTFLLAHTAPGSPFSISMKSAEFGYGPNLEGDPRHGTNQMARLNQYYGFDGPMVDQLFIWFSKLIKMDLGESTQYQEPVLQVIIRKSQITMIFGLLTLLIAYGFGVLFGMYKALHVQTTMDRITDFVLIVCFGVPSTLVALLLIVYFAGFSYLDLFPIGGIKSDYFCELSWYEKLGDLVHHGVLPLVCYCLSAVAQITLFTKNTVLEIRSKDYIKVARAKGLRWGTVNLRHAFRNAVVPLLSGTTSTLSAFATSTIVIENIFDLDGLGNLSLKSIMVRDYNMIIGLTFFGAMGVLALQLILDLTSLKLDPRLRWSSR